MCHETAEIFVRQCVAKFGLGLGAGSTVLEVGCATGPDWMDLFPDDAQYTGVDRKPGPRVDLTCDFESADLGRQFNVVICAEVLEHTLHPWRLVENLAKHTTPGGHVIVTARGYDTEGYAPVHDAPHDYWRMTPVSLGQMMEDAGIRVLDCEEDTSPAWPGALAYGRRTGWW